MSHMSQLLEFQECYRKANRIVALVGAGLSASSGLPVFRGSQGLWKNFNMIDLATPDAFYIDPGLVWQFYSWRRHLALAANPNKGHYALAQLSNDSSKEFITISQNVDGLLTRAGHCKESLNEIHGSLFQLKCTSFTCTYFQKDNFVDPLTKALKIDEDEHSFRSSLDTLTDDDDDDDDEQRQQFSAPKPLEIDELPKCPICGTLMRPGVVWFGESLPLRALDDIDDFLQAGPVDLILVIGTSGTVYPANSYVDMVRRHGGAVAVFNTDIEEEILDGRVAKTWGFLGDASEWLPKALNVQ